jgi:hypothetical protein
MDTSVGTRPYPPHDQAALRVGAIESVVSATSWAAIFAGAAVAAAASMMLLSLGAGLGFASVSLRSYANPSVTSFTVMTAIWLIVVQWLASGLGGYMTGRLRTKWVNVHTHEVFFRDTAHGFLAWAVATVLVAAIAASGAASAIGGVQAASTVASGAAQRATAAGDARSYTVDTLFRASAPDATASKGDDERAEAARILAMGVVNGDVPAVDRSYLAMVVAARTGIAQGDAEKRVDDAIAQTKAAADKARQAVDQARKAAAAFAMFTALSMVIGAFIASVAAAYGGHLRDEHA